MSVVKHKFQNIAQQGIQLYRLKFFWKRKKLKIIQIHCRNMYPGRSSLKYHYEHLLPIRNPPESKISVQEIGYFNSTATKIAED